ncbi:MAG: hypothetical protein CMJ84_01950 [Planctomycetes bacterium]|jgi:hypothetical protein|nr:hypothetical protein [Planctomycetota bacterium]MDP6408667.1 hypothetical protein [Planctomycetota bacterium]
MASTPEANEQHRTNGRPTNGAGKAWSWTLLTVGCAAMGAGALAASGDALDAHVPWLASRLAELGASPALLFGAGGIAFCLGTLRSAVGHVQRNLAPGGDPEPVLEDLATQVLVNRKDATRLLQETQTVGEGVRQLLQVSGEQAAAHATGQHDEAAFRLAASVDQLGAALGERMSQQGSHADQRFGAVDHVLERICEQLVELRGGLEEIRGAGERIEAEIAAGRAREEAAAEEDAQEPCAQEQDAWSNDWQANTSSEPACEVPRKPPMPTSPASGAEAPLEPEELEIVVTLEEEPEEVEHEARETSLGLLDSIDEFGDYHAPVDTPTAREAEPPCGENRAGERTEQSSVEHQLAQLRSLLSEAELREVLDGFRRGAEDQLG